MQKNVEIYALCDPDTGKVRYIGKANDSRKRLVSHFRDMRRRNTPVYCWIRKLTDGGKFPVLKVLETVPDNEWREAEIRLIAQYRKTTKLLNIADGGDEPYCSKKVRKQNGRKVSKLRISTPEKALIYHHKRALGQTLHDKYLPEASKEKIRGHMRMLYKKRPDLFACWANI